MSFLVVLVSTLFVIVFVTVCVYCEVYSSRYQTTRSNDLQRGLVKSLSNT